MEAIKDEDRAPVQNDVRPSEPLQDEPPDGFGEDPLSKRLDIEAERQALALKLADLARSMILHHGYDGPCMGYEFEPLMVAIIEYDAACVRVSKIDSGV